MGDGAAHGRTDVPYYLAGRLQGRLETGRWLNYNNVSHYDLLDSIATAMGTDIGSPDYPKYGNDGLSNLFT